MHPAAFLQKIPGPGQLKPIQIALVAYGGTHLQPEGIVNFMCEMPKGKSDLQFFVTKDSSTPILGRDAFEGVGEQSCCNREEKWVSEGVFGPTRS